MQRPTTNIEPTSNPNSSYTSVLHEAFAIAVGGALGASLRYAVLLGTQSANQHAAWATAGANGLGALLLGMVVARVDSPRAHPLIRPFLVVGVFGSFTTFSALAFDNRTLALQHGELVALLHIAGSILAGLLAFAAGSAIARGRR
jgi:CrcB protein